MEKAIQQNQECASRGLWSFVGGVVLLAAAFLLVKNFPDIRRYLKIEMM